jgi:hypothetical protein
LCPPSCQVEYCPPCSLPYSPQQAILRAVPRSRAAAIPGPPSHPPTICGRSRVRSPLLSLNELTRGDLLYAVEELGRVIFQIRYYHLDLYGTCREHVNSLYNQVAAVHEILSILVNVLRDQEDADSDKEGAGDADSNEVAESMGRNAEAEQP